MQVKIQVEIPVQHGRDVLTTAWEGGSDYWIGSYEPDVHRLRSENPDTNGTVDSISFDSPMGDEENDQPMEDGVFSVTAEDIIRAVGKVLNRDVKVGDHIIKDLENNLEEIGGCDADTADVLLQVAVFGDVIYG